MPISEPLKVSISPKAMRSEWWISPTGGVKSPAASNAHPKAHMAVAIMSCKRFIQVCDYISYALWARNPNHPNQMHPFLVEIV